MGNHLKNQFLRLRVSDPQRRRYTEAAARRGMTLSEWVRHQLELAADRGSRGKRRSR